MRLTIIALMLSFVPSASVFAQTSLEGSVLRIISGVDGSRAIVTAVQGRLPGAPVSYVSLCVSNPKSHKSTKGMKLDTSAALLVDPGQTLCLALSAGPQDILLLTRLPTGELHRSMALALDLTGFKRQEVLITWVAEALH